MRTDSKQAVARTSASPALHLAAITAAFVLAGCAEQQKPIAPKKRLLHALRPTLALRDVLLVAEPQNNDPSDGLRQGCADELASSLVGGKSLATTKEGETS